jgi:hypothetical protein
MHNLFLIVLVSLVLSSSAFAGKSDKPASHKTNNPHLDALQQQALLKQQGKQIEPRRQTHSMIKERTCTLCSCYLKFSRTSSTIPPENNN